ncbi:hCG1984934 [Homo sapiens]|uniref:Putative uncharacterized protein IBA57-DT n=1 Tax=Homo sapiens TaxID=9606 RepID=IBADT_HUMAN|nr:RecName: Full=Putative uncharacterized protein IBA57-DT; AltName: Full=IBA57 antisense RNA 1; AltName: Full=IBA57 antisense gene protein 1; AltName: Full=IBA57 divergent transcripte [Homo sapiens]EAW69861.1 hCG1984934 [Homo sapiens]
MTYPPHRAFSRSDVPYPLLSSPVQWPLSLVVGDTSTRWPQQPSALESDCPGPSHPCLAGLLGPMHPVDIPLSTALHSKHQRRLTQCVLMVQSPSKQRSLYLLNKKIPHDA